MALTKAQADVSDYANPSAPTLGSTPTEGNFLVLIAGERSGTSHTAFTHNGSGWTKAQGYDNELSDSGARISAAIWWKRAGASEPTSVSVDNGTANSIRAALIEIAPADTGTGYAAGGASANGTGTGSTSPLGTGSTASLSSADYIELAFGIWRQSTDNLSGMAIDITQDISGSEGIPQSNGVGLYYEALEGTFSGTRSASVSWTGSGHEAIAMILDIEVESGGGGGGLPIPVAMHHYQLLRNR